MLDIFNIEISNLIHIDTIVKQESIQNFFYYKKYILEIEEYISPKYLIFRVNKISIEDNYPKLLMITTFDIFHNDIKEFGLEKFFFYMKSLESKNTHINHYVVIKDYFSILRKEKIKKLLNL